jgi:ubiquinone/menaquinone biosynthesis C-methylase UbiE
MRQRVLHWVTAVILIFAAVACAHGETTETPPPAASADLNEKFLAPDLDVEQWVNTFEVESREVYAARTEVLGATGVKAGSRVADVGAGTGLYTRLFSETVGSNGWVYAVDISPGFLEHINTWAAQETVSNVTAVLGRTDSTTLAPGSIDVAFVCDTYHHFETPADMLASIHDSLAPDGRLVVVDFDRIPGKTREWLLDHVRAGKEVFREEIEAGGFAFVEEVKISGFEENYFIKFRKK